MLSIDNFDESMEGREFGVYTESDVIGQWSLRARGQTLRETILALPVEVTEPKMLVVSQTGDPPLPFWPFWPLSEDVIAAMRRQAAK